MTARKKTGRPKKSPKARPRRKEPPAPPASSALGDRITEIVERIAVGALRLAVEVGGRELGAWPPQANETRREAGAYLRELRELAGLTRAELADAVDLRDGSRLAAVEAGTATLSFELILRLAAVLARHDPAPFVARLARSYNPVLWELLKDWGVARLPLQRVREREFVNILRGSDQARALPDEDFARVLDFTRAAFETALHFAWKSGEAAAPPRRGPPRS